ncbi:hypothetical protein D3C84_1290800 [compost metagenome]
MKIHIINLSLVTTKIVTNYLLNVNGYCNVDTIGKEQWEDKKSGLHSATAQKIRF